MQSHFNPDRHTHRRGIFEQNRAAALDEWRRIGAWECCPLVIGSITVC